MTRVDPVTLAQVGASALAGVIAMAVAFLVILILVEIYDHFAGTWGPPAVWRRPICWLLGHVDHRHGDEVADAPASCDRCCAQLRSARP